ncbi:MAG: type II secretion system F family protein [Planctomycetes bacterium]|nr:type II secretion system F family protein [Planctomycetota bacterium]MBU4398903.1 type II secretion system F family protein [Planctomycetota bacterium]
MTTISIIAALPPGFALQAAGSAVVGLAVAMLAWWIFAVLRSEDLQQGIEWRYDVSRINELRRADWFFRLLQPAVQLLARGNRKVFREGLPAINREIQAAGLPRFWLPEEYLGKIELIALFCAPIFVYFFFGWFGGVGLAIAVLLVALTAWLLRRRLAARAKARLNLIKRRMPFLLDLLTLLMEAGSTFLGAMKQAVGEFQGHPLAEEFGRVLTDMNLGKTRTESLLAMRDRLADDEITSIIGSIVQGETLGTPLANIFRTQADVLRIKRTQRAELMAGEAGVNMLLPGVLVMVATVLIIIGPFLLNYFYFGLSL